MNDFFKEFAGDIDKREICLKLDGEGFVFDPLASGTGNTLEDFQTEGTVAFAMDMLNSCMGQDRCYAGGDTFEHLYRNVIRAV